MLLDFVYSVQTNSQDKKANGGLDLHLNCPHCPLEAGPDGLQVTLPLLCVRSLLASNKLSLSLSHKKKKKSETRRLLMDQSKTC